MSGINTLLLEIKERNRLKIKERRKRRYEAHKEEERLNNKIWLSNHRDYMKNYNKQHWIKNREKRLREYDQSKIDAYNKIGGCKCSLCGDSIMSHLTIDHINKDGNVDRKNGMVTATLLRAIVNNKLSKTQLENLRVLCWNCNKSRSRDYMDLPYEQQTYSQRHIHKLWKEAFNFFGPCKTCGETNLKFLSISHIHEDGAERRRNGEKQGPKLLSNFRKMNWPQSLKEDFCLECYTCNCSKAIKRPMLVSPSDPSVKEG